MSAPDTVSSWLYRPYRDLSQAIDQAPHHVQALTLGHRSIADDIALPKLQASLNPSFRRELARESGDERFRITRPADLPAGERSEAWQDLCDWTEGFSDLPGHQQVRVAWLLAKLCFFDEAERLLESQSLAGDEAAAGLAYLRSWCRFRNQLDDPKREFSPDEFAAVAATAPISLAKVDACYQSAAISAKYRGDLVATEHWQTEHRAAIDALAPEIDASTHSMLLSRYHRLQGFVPQMRRDAVGVVAEMQLAEDHARAMDRGDDIRRLAADEMLYPVLESRIKEALWLQDLDAARERSIEITTLSPNDPRAWLHRGQTHVAANEVEEAARAYNRSRRCAPPGAEIASFMLGQCLEHLGDVEGACDAYLDCLRADPYAVSAAEALATLGPAIAGPGVSAWAAFTAEELRRQEATEPGRVEEPYRTFAPPEESA